MDCNPDDVELEKNSAEQKIVLLLRMATASMPARRITESGSAEAKGLLDKARDEAAEAKSAFEQGCYAQASTFAAAGLNTASAAFRSGSDTNAAEANKYGDLQRRVSSLLDAAEKQDDKALGVSVEEVTGMRRQLARAEQLALQGEHTEAIPLLAPIADRLERRLVDMFDKRTLVYSKDFASPAEEYAYLAEYYRGYRLLLDSHATRDMQAMADVLLVAEESFNGAKTSASHEQWADALEAVRRAIEHCERASRVAGIYY